MRYGEVGGEEEEWKEVVNNWDEYALLAADRTAYSAAEAAGGFSGRVQCTARGWEDRRGRETMARVCGEFGKAGRYTRVRDR
jgi:hypothetical protein